jgi:hypothetical protein
MTEAEILADSDTFGEVAHYDATGRLVGIERHRTPDRIVVTMEWMQNPNLYFVKVDEGGITFRFMDDPLRYNFEQYLPEMRAWSARLGEVI